VIRLMASVPPLVTPGVEVGQHLGPPGARRCDEGGRPRESGGSEGYRALWAIWRLSQERRGRWSNLLVALPGHGDLIGGIADIWQRLILVC
jgi:hypothetical protein